MRAVLCRELGGPEALRLEEIEEPAAGPGQVKIRVKAAAFNFLDTLIIRGQYQDKPPLPFVPGAEAAGEVVSVGEGVSRLKPGQSAIALCGTGAFAEYLVVDAARALPVPGGFPLDIAAGLATAYGTSHYALKQLARLQPRETLLVLGAAGGVGLAAVQIGRAMGARVIAAASSADKLAAAARAGASDGINYLQSDLREQVKALTAGKGVDVVYDPVGAQLAEAAVRSLAWGGRYLVVGFAGGHIPSLPLNLLLLKGASAIGVFWGAWVQRDPGEAAAGLGEVMRWVAEGTLQPRIQQRFALSDFRLGFEALQDRLAVGKVILDIG